MKGQFFGVFLFVFMERGNWPGFVPGSSGQGPARWMQIIEAPPRGCKSHLPMRIVGCCAVEALLLAKSFV
jgi:hypothetical protein